MRSLVFIGDAWHSPRVARAGLEELGAHGFEFDWIDHAGDCTAKRMHPYRVLILARAYNSSCPDSTARLSESVQQALLDHTENGNGLLALHSGAAVDANAKPLRSLVGGCFAGHPEQCLVTVEPSDSHRLAAGCESFEIIDEHYSMCLDDAGTDVFVRTTSEHGTQPAGWARRQGKGRVCVLTPGHGLAVWMHPGYQRLLLNALRWCGAAEE